MLFTDDFNRANGALTGSTPSGGGFTYDSAGDEDIQTVTSNRARFAGMTDGFTAIALVDTQATGDDLFTQVDLSTWIRPGFSAMGWRLFLGINDTLTSGYMARGGTDGTSPGFQVRALTLETDIVDQTDLITSGVLRFQRVGNLFSLTHNGTPLFTPLTDTDEPTGSGNRYVGFGVSWDANGESGTRMVEFDNLIGGDVPTVSLAAIMHHLRQQMAD